MEPRDAGRLGAENVRKRVPLEAFLAGNPAATDFRTDLQECRAQSSVAYTMSLVESIIAATGNCAEALRLLCPPLMAVLVAGWSLPRIQVGHI